MAHKIDTRISMRIKATYGGGDLSCPDLLDILENCISQGATRGRNKLLQIIARSDRHTNIAEHVTGSKDKTMHITIRVDGKGYHLRLDGKGNVFQITGKLGDLGTIPPWIAPGTNYP